MTKKPYDSTVARIAGNLLSGMELWRDSSNAEYAWDQLVTNAVKVARRIVAEVQRTEPEVAPPVQGPT